MMNLESKYLDYAVEKISDLCNLPSPTGYTKLAVNYVVDECKKIGIPVKTSNKNSVIAEFGGDNDPIVFAAHLDTLGAMVRAIKSNGRIRISRIGGYPVNNIETETCVIHTRNGKKYSGTFQILHPAVHVYDDVKTMKRSEENIEIVIDEKVKSKKDVRDLGIEVGDFVSLDPRTKITDSGFIKSRHLDDKASAGILLSFAKYIVENKIKLNRKVYLVFTTYEEVGHGGSAGVPKDIVEMISVDMGAVGDDLGTDEYCVSICAKDSGGPYDYDVTSKLIECAKKEELNYSVDVYPHYGSDVEATLRAGLDIKHGLIGPGVFASHGYERTHKDGIENTLKLILSYIQSK